MSDDKEKAEFWAAQAMMWHEKYKSVLGMEEDCHRYHVALEKLAGITNECTKERVREIAKRALFGGR